MDYLVVFFFFFFTLDFGLRGFYENLNLFEIYCKNGDWKSLGINILNLIDKSSLCCQIIDF